jgi:hypothetical protein
MTRGIKAQTGSFFIIEPHKTGEKVVFQRPSVAVESDA